MAVSGSAVINSPDPKKTISYMRDIMNLGIEKWS
jgi:hypothetical protein